MRRKILRRRGVGFRLTFVAGLVVYLAMKFRVQRVRGRWLIADLVIEVTRA